MQALRLTKKYERYPEYKDSGVEWLGEIPKDWEVTRLKQVLDYEQPGNHITSNIDSGSFENQKMTPVLTANKAFIIGYSTDKNSIYSKNLPVVIFDDFTTDKKIVDFPFKLRSSAIKILKSRKKSNIRFLFRYMEALKPCILEHNRHWISVYSNEYIALPSDSEQTRIVDHLERKIALIDQIIEKKKKQIELLREKRTAIINQAVTKGLDPNAELVDSGIDWLRKIPRGWKVEKLKYVASQRNKKISNSAQNDYQYIGLENIESETGRLLESEQNIEEGSILNSFKAGDLLFGKLRPYLAKVFTPDFDGVCTGELLDLIPDARKVIQQFLFFRLVSKNFIKLIDDSTYGSKMPRANWEFIGNQKISLPQLSEQNEVVRMLDDKMKLIGKIIIEIENSIKKLQEFKSSLISSVVTGKIRV